MQHLLGYMDYLFTKELGMIREQICCKSCGHEYDERWREGRTDVKIVFEGVCSGCEKLEEIFDMYKNRRRSHESHA